MTVELSKMGYETFTHDWYMVRGKLSANAQLRKKIFITFLPRVGNACDECEHDTWTELTPDNCTCLCHVRVTE